MLRSRQIHNLRSSVCHLLIYKGGQMSKPELKLIGEDGNVFFILGKAVREAKRAGWDEEKIKQFKEDAMSGDYNHVLQLCMEHFDVI